MYFELNNQTVSTRCFSFEAGNGTNEYHAILQVENPLLTYVEQLASIQEAYSELLTRRLPQGTVAIMKRYFLSDAANQADLLMSGAVESSDCALSVVEQPPLNGAKIALWVYFLTGVETKNLSNGLYEVTHGPYRHLWGAGAVNHAATSEYQTRLLLNEYVMQLAQVQGTLLNNCVRTWFYVQNIDTNYGGVVKARNEVFVTQGLTVGTHYIASTGIGGRSAQKEEIVRMDTYALLGIQPRQIGHLYAPTHLNPTHEYGVSFERGSYVDYGDRRQVFISGTASINNKGEVVHPGDIRKQTARMWENVGTLLAEAECGFEHVAHFLVYLRDAADYSVVSALFAERFPSVPTIIVLAPVCRPGWLIEMECMAVKSVNNPAFACF